MEQNTLENADFSEYQNWRHDTQHNDIQHNDTRHKWFISGTQHNHTVIILNVVVLSVIMLNVVTPQKLPFTWRHLLVKILIYI
jgi:hypothetical protein